VQNAFGPFIISTSLNCRIYLSFGFAAWKFGVECSDKVVSSFLNDLYGPKFVEISVIVDGVLHDHYSCGL
jgi:hypothetical protein